MRTKCLNNQNYEYITIHLYIFYFLELSYLIFCMLVCSMYHYIMERNEKMCSLV